MFHNPIKAKERISQDRKPVLLNKLTNSEYFKVNKQIIRM